MTKRKPSEDIHDNEEAEILGEFATVRREAAKTDTAVAALVRAVELLARAQFCSARRIELTVYGMMPDVPEVPVVESVVERKAG